MLIPAPHPGAILDPERRTFRRRRAPIALVAAMFAALVALPATALAHAELDTVTPADASTVTGAPTEVVMTFTETLDPAKSSIKLVDAGGTVVVEGSTVDSADAKVMRLALPAGLAAGPYTARWISASAQDGDLDHGTTTFTVAAAPSASPSPSATPAPSASATPAASIAPTVAPSPSAPATTPTVSTSDAVIPIAIALVVLVGLGLWLLRGRARSR